MHPRERFPVPDRRLRASLLPQRITPCRKVAARHLRPEMSPDLTIRLATADDTPVLRALIEESARVLSRGFYTEQETDSAVRHVFGVDSRLVADGTYYVAEREGAPVACGGWSRWRTMYGGDQRPIGEAELLDPSRDPARIRAFFVAPAAARQGVGRALLARCASDAAAAGFRSLTLMATLPGVPFYESLGFRRVEDVVDVLPDGVPLRFVRMERDVDH